MLAKGEIMQNKYRVRGATLVEMIIVCVVIAIVFISISTLSIQASKVYARTNIHIEPQASQMLAMTRMQQEIREAIEVVNNDPLTNQLSNEKQITIIIPQKDSYGLNITTNVNGALQIQEDTTCYIRFRQEVYPVGSNTAHILMEKIDRNSNTVVGSTEIIHGLALTPMNPDPAHPGQNIAGKLFEYYPLNDNGTPNDPTDDTIGPGTRLVKITLSIPLNQNTPTGGVTVYHTLHTEFALRNCRAGMHLGE